MDAASSAIYGSRAPFGVILVTTKRGEKGKANITYSNNFRWSRPTRIPDMPDSYRWALYMNRGEVNNGQADYSVISQTTIENIQKYMAGEITTTCDLNGEQDGKYPFNTTTLANENWPRNFLDKTSFGQEHNINVSGGTDKVQYYVSGAFLSQDGQLNYSDESKYRYNVTGRVGAYCNNMHTVFPTHYGTNGTYGRFTADQNSDNMAGTSHNDNFLLRRSTVPSSGSYSSFSTIRTINLFLQRTAENLENGTLADDSVNQHYIGEMYFFRAYVYYSFLTTYGDMPIITEVLDEKTDEEVTEANKRQPRNEVARFILDDLDQAIERLQNKGSEPTANRRVNKQVAQLFKSRVALFEGTWEKYHAGTARVPDKSAGWPGASMDYNADFTLFAADGLRLDDLYRWRALDNMEEWYFYGFNYWTYYVDLYDNTYGTETSDAASVLGLSSEDVGPYLRLYPNDNLASGGYTFDEANYLSPLSYDVFRLACTVEGDVSTTVVYQNPDWPITAGEYSLTSGD